MSCRRKPRTIVQNGQVQWNDDDIDVDSFGVEAPQREAFKILTKIGQKYEEVNRAIREKYVKYLERMTRKNEEEQRKAAT